MSISIPSFSAYQQFHIDVYAAAAEQKSVKPIEGKFNNDVLKCPKCNSFNEV
jgi:hypothetical protein